MTEREQRLKTLAFDVLMAEVWSAGWGALSSEYQRQRRDPNYPIGKGAQNPYLPEGQVHP